MSCRAHRNILITLSCLVHGDSSRALVADVEAVAEGTLGGLLMSCHAQKKPQIPSSPRSAACSCGLSCPVCLAPEGFSCHVMYCPVCLALEGYLVLACLSSPRGLMIPPK